MSRHQKPEFYNASDLFAWALDYDRRPSVPAASTKAAPTEAAEACIPAIVIGCCAGREGNLYTVACAQALVTRVGAACDFSVCGVARSCGHAYGHGRLLVVSGKYRHGLVLAFARDRSGG